MAEPENGGENPIAWVYTVPETEAEGIVKANYEAGRKKLGIPQISRASSATGPSSCAPTGGST